VTETGRTEKLMVCAWTSPWRNFLVIAR